MTGQPATWTLQARAADRLLTAMHTEHDRWSALAAAVEQARATLARTPGEDARKAYTALSVAYQDYREWLADEVGR